MNFTYYTVFVHVIMFVKDNTVNVNLSCLCVCMCVEEH